MSVKVSKHPKVCHKIKNVFRHFKCEQMRTIQKELGEDEEGAAEIAELDKAITEAKMPADVEKQARKELKRLERMPEGAGEHSMIRTYLDRTFPVWVLPPTAPT